MQIYTYIKPFSLYMLDCVGRCYANGCSVNHMLTIAHFDQAESGLHRSEVSRSVHTAEDPISTGQSRMAR